MYGIRDNCHWVVNSYLELTTKPKEALSFKTFEQAREWMNDNNLLYFCVVKLS